jgi:hypothetical protein
LALAGEGETVNGRKRASRLAPKESIRRQLPAGTPKNALLSPGWSCCCPLPAQGFSRIYYDPLIRMLLVARPLLL